MEKSATLPLKTVNNIVTNTLDGKVKCSKSFVKIVFIQLLLTYLDAALRKCLYWSTGYGTVLASREG